jgi:hypothetical protein
VRFLMKFIKGENILEDDNKTRRRTLKIIIE